MLILSRKKAERILIGNGIVISVVEIRGDRVKLGFDAPREVRIDREEIAGKREKREESGGNACCTPSPT